MKVHIYELVTDEGASPSCELLGPGKEELTISMAEFKGLALLTSAGNGNQQDC